jgi:tetratricopeptide (TPR) repeat protein
MTMADTLRALPLLAALLLALLLPGSAQAGEEATDPERAAQIQEQAKEALDDGRLDEAGRLAGRAVELDPSLSTWLARQVRIEALEQQGRYEAALTYIEEYLDLDGLFAEHRAWGKEARQRIRDAMSAGATRQAEATRRGLGVGLVVGGAVPLGVGVGFLANYGRLGGDFDTYGGWMQTGVALLAVGAAIDVVGAILLATAGPPDRRTAALDRRRPRVAVGVHVGASRFSLQLRF